MQPRTISTKEQEEFIGYCLAHYYGEATAEDKEVQASFVADGAVAVFDRYTTDGPGYAGKLMTVVWSGSPSNYTVFIWTDGNLHEVKREG